MSRIIKSYRIIEEKPIPVEVDRDQVEGLDIGENIKAAMIQEGQQESVRIIAQANEGAKKILEEAYLEADKILERAERKTNEIFQKAKLEGYEKGHKDGEKTGYSEGYSKGYEEGENRAQELIEEALAIKKDYIEIRNNTLKELEQDIIHLVISIYEKVLYKKVEEDEDLIVSLVLKGIDNLDVSEKLTIIVSQGDYERVKQSKNLILAKASLVNKVDIRINSDMKKGDCMIETSMGSVDVGIRSQIEEVEDLLINILSNE